MVERLAVFAVCLVGCDPRSTVGCGGEPDSEVEIVKAPGTVKLSMECTGPLVLESAKAGTPVYYRTNAGPTSDVADRVVGLRLPVALSEESQELRVVLNVGDPSVGTLDFGLDGEGEGEGVPRATVTLGDDKNAGKSARLNITRADNVLSGTLSLELSTDRGAAAAAEASCTIALTDVPFVPFVHSQVMWEGKDDAVRLSYVSTSGPIEGPDSWTVQLPSGVDGALSIKLQGVPAVGAHELPTDAIRAVVEGNENATLSKASVTIKKNAYGTYDADVDAVVDLDGEAVPVRGTMFYMTTREFRSERAAEAREAVDLAR